MTMRVRHRWILVMVVGAAVSLLMLATHRESVVLADQSANSDSWDCNVSESEPNDDANSANSIAINDVMCGHLSEPAPNALECEDDIHRISLPSRDYILVELSSASDVWVYLTDSQGEHINFPYTDGGLMFSTLEAGDYFLNVTHVHKAGTVMLVCPWGGLSYKVTVSSPLLISAAARDFKEGGTVDGIQFYSEDVLAWSKLNNGAERWRMFLDGSDIKLRANVTSIAAESAFGETRWDNHDELLLTVADNPNDVLMVEPLGPSLSLGWTQPAGYGEFTQLNKETVVRLTEYGLSGRSERVNGLDGLIYNDAQPGTSRSCSGLLLSTNRYSEVTTWGGSTMKQANDDAFCLVYDKATRQWGPFDYFFDVSNKDEFDSPAPEPAPGRIRGLPRKNVVAVAYNEGAGMMYLVVRGRGMVLGNAVTTSDIFAISYPGYAWGGIVWHGPDHGWNYEIDAIEWTGW